MDDDDDLVPEPDEKGILDLTNRAWVNLDPVIFTMSFKLIVLDISHNHITFIPSQIEELILLRELRAAFNKIVSLPPEIGRLKRLKKLIVNNNRLKRLPQELGHLEQLEDLILSENNLEEIPSSLANMSALRVLKLQNNKLRSLPYELGEVLTLDEVDCAGNADLDMLPPRWRGDTQSILFVLRVYRDNLARMEEITVANADLTKHSQYLEQEQLVMKEKMIELKYQMEELLKLIPKGAKSRIERAAKIAAEEDNGIEGGAGSRNILDSVPGCCVS